VSPAGGGALAGDGQHLVAVVAHPDDETFGCGSLLAAAAAAGARVAVVCATRGEEGEFRPDHSTGHLPLAAVRERELRDAAEVLGVHEVVVLDHRDSGFAGDLPPRALVGVDLDTLADELAGVLAGLAPDVLVTLDGCDGHRDHVHLRDAVGRAAVALDPVPRVVHSSLSRRLMGRWLAEVASVSPDRAYLALDPETLGRSDDELTPIDTSGVLAVREAAIACHRSQASPYDGLSPDLRRAFLATDHVVEVDLTFA
jgi:LmbE family N-acetylglucosaminyl deacetylase